MGLYPYFDSMNDQILQAATSLQAGQQATNGVGANVITQSVSDSSIFSYFWNASFLIKIVILSLIIASVYSWALIISNRIKLKRLNKEADYFEEEFWSGTPLENLYKQIHNSASDPMTVVFCAAMSEWEQAVQDGNLKPETLMLRVEKAMEVAINRETVDLEQGLPMLSGIGTNGVIIGLFGTVLGILNGFKTIAIQQSASIAVLGPIISEALVTTAFGIITAIPAAFGYSKQKASVNKYINRLEIFAEDFSLIILRQVNTISEQ